MAEPIPRVLDHALVRPIGRGAFGQVWLARNAVGTYRAAKVVSRSALDGEPDFKREYNGIQRFEPVSRLHEGLIDVLQIGRADDESYFYYVMELGDDAEPRQEFVPTEYEPRTLSAECRRRTRIPAAEAALIGAQLSDALEFLHSRGLIHRDIKPSNVLFVRGQPRIGDPGLVTSIEASQSLGGTLGYIAPEGPGTPQADIFSLGKLLYVISTAKEPGQFPVLPPEMTGYADADDLRRLNHVILRACAYNPKDRYVSAAELRQDLLEVHAGGSPGEARRRLQIAKRIGVGLVILLLLIGAGFYRARLQAKAERDRLAKNHLDTAIRLQEENDTLGALPYLGNILATQSDEQNDLTARRISFIWRYSPRLIAQWYFSNAVNRIAFDSSGAVLAVAGSSGDVWLWRWGRPAPPIALGRHQANGASAEVEGVAVSPDGRWLASVGMDRVLRLWSMDSNAPNRTIALPDRARSVAFHPKTNLLAIGCEPNRVLLANPDEPTPKLLFTTAGAVNCVAFSPDGTRLLVGDRSGYVNELKLDTAGRPKPAVTKLIWIYEVSYNRDGSLWSAASGYRAEVRTMTGTVPARLKHGGLVRSVAFDPSQIPGSDRLLTASLDNTVRLWSCAEDEKLMPPIHTERQPSGAVFSPGGTAFAVSTIGGLVRVYSPPSVDGDTGTNRTTVSPDGNYYVRREHATNGVVYEATTDRMVNRLSTDDGRPIEYLELSRDGRTLLLRQPFTNHWYQFDVREVKSGRVVATNFLNDDAWGNLSPSGDHVAFRQHQQFSVWRPGDGRFRSWPWSVQRLNEDLEIRFSARGDRVVAGWSNHVAVYSLADGQPVAEWDLRHRAHTVDISPDGRLVVAGESPSGFGPSTNFVWDVATRQRVSPPLELEDGSYVARFSNGGRFVIISDQQGNFLLHEVGTDKVIPVRQRFGMVTDAVFSLDDLFVATSTEDRGGQIPSIQVWDVSTGTPVTPALSSGTSAFGRVRFLAGDSALLWVNHGRSYWRRWQLVKLSAPASHLIDLARLLSCQSITPSGQSAPIPPAELQRLWNELSTAHPDWFFPPK